MSTIPEPDDIGGYPADTGQSIGELLSNVTSDLSTLIHQELELAKVEAKQSAQQAGRGAGMFAGAGVAAHVMLIFVSAAVMYLLASWMHVGWAALIVGLVWGAIAGVLALRGKKEFTNIGMQQTAETTAKIPNALKGNETR